MFRAFDDGKPAPRRICRAPIPDRRCQRQGFRIALASRGFRAPGCMKSKTASAIFTRASRSRSVRPPCSVMRIGLEAPVSRFATSSICSGLATTATGASHGGMVSCAVPTSRSEGISSSVEPSGMGLGAITAMGEEKCSPSLASPTAPENFDSVLDRIPVHRFNIFQSPATKLTGKPS